MFTGLVEEMGSVIDFQGGRLQIRANLVLKDVCIGDSIAVNGCCLTVTGTGDDWWSSDVVSETLGRTTLGRLSSGSPVNLERPVQPTGRLGGHIVQGHIDCTGEVLEIGSVMRVRIPETQSRYIVEKGSIAIDGVSLTVASAEGDEFEVALIPHTSHVTTLGSKAIGDYVNIEVDLLAKYVDKLLGGVAR
ncbi:MAG TPA: riboflavin synthase [Acidimicrobiales bacterium]|nr:riboflavin synthase [Acidimicrobiales bacterium]